MSKRVCEQDELCFSELEWQSLPEMPTRPIDEFTGANSRWFDPKLHWPTIGVDGNVAALLEPMVPCTELFLAFCADSVPISMLPLANDRLWTEPWLAFSAGELLWNPAFWISSLWNQTLVWVSHYDGRALNVNPGLQHPLCMVQCTHLITTGGTLHLYNRGSSMQVNSLCSGANNI